MDLLSVINDLVEEKGLDRSVLSSIVAEGMMAAYVKKYPQVKLQIDYDKKNGDISVLALKTVVSSVKDELKEIGFKYLGKNVLISNKTSIYNAKNITIGNNTRIDDFCILSAGEGGIEIGDYVHIACYSSLIGKGKIQMNDYSGPMAANSVLGGSFGSFF